jgi:NAD-dependent SIR2 family protein deacetylase
MRNPLQTRRSAELSLNDVIAKCIDCEREITNSDRFSMMMLQGDILVCPSCGGCLRYNEEEEVG